MGLYQAARAATGALARNLKPRRKRHPLWLQSRRSGEYRLSRSLDEIATPRLGAIKRSDVAKGCLTLFAFIARCHSGPDVYGRDFVIDRRELAADPSLGLTEKRIRTATVQLVQHGLIERAPTQGSAFHRTADGVQRKPVLYRFTSVIKRAIEKLLTVLKKWPKCRSQSLHVEGNRKQNKTSESEAIHMGRNASGLSCGSPIHRNTDTKAQGRPLSMFDPPRRIDLASIANDGLRAVLERLGAGVMRRNAINKLCNE
jgi:hypothetical protein